MPALAGTALLQKLLETSTEKCRYVPKSGGDPIKAKIVEIFVGKKKKDGKEGARLIPLEDNPEEKVYFIPVERLKGIPGRYAYGSPAKSPEADSPEPEKPAKNKAKTPEKKEEKKSVKKSVNDEAFSLESAREEMKDISEALTDLAERANTIAAFIETIEMESPEPEEAEEEASPEPEKPAKNKAKASRSSAKPRHGDEDEA